MNNIIDDQLGLFGEKKVPSQLNSSKPIEQSSPLAFRARPEKLKELKGHHDLFTKYPFLKGENFPSIIIFGPPGTGKTTLAQILAYQCGKEFFRFNAVLGGVNELKKLIARAEEMKTFHGTESIIFIDEIHRFNKAQQDALLPYVEAGSFTLIGATTENPRSSVNRALLSRLQTVELKGLSNTDIGEILEQAAKRFNIVTTPDIMSFIASYCSGDARKALNLFELVEKNPKATLKELKPTIVDNSRNYDKSDDRHYDVISAFIKSMRGSDPDATLIWLAIMLDGGEDPVFIARRLVVFASEDVGNADIGALPLAVAALQAVQSIGMPEARINLAQAATYLASTVKSNAAYMGINEALEYVQSKATIDTPNHLKNQHPEKKNYLYPHSYEGSFIDQRYTVEETPNFYRPTSHGHEKNILNRLRSLWPKRNK
ncbi:MAG: replication-associated recombination protein A [Bacteriovoracaceae bacterium]|nr:replication-associated recombination protein A [Bacteriovoracaceae bacterium]